MSGYRGPFQGPYPGCAGLHRLHLGEQAATRPMQTHPNGRARYLQHHRDLLAGQLLPRHQPQKLPIIGTQALHRDPDDRGANTGRWHNYLAQRGTQPLAQRESAVLAQRESAALAAVVVRQDVACGAEQPRTRPLFRWDLASFSIRVRACLHRSAVHRRRPDAPASGARSRRTPGREGGAGAKIMFDR